MKQVKEVCALFNSVRVKNTGIYSHKEMKSLLRGVLNFDQCAVNLKKYGCIVMVGRGKYRFPSEPVYISKISTIISLYRKYNREMISMARMYEEYRKLAEMGVRY